MVAIPIRRVTGTHGEEGGSRFKDRPVGFETGCSSRSNRTLFSLKLCFPGERYVHGFYHSSDAGLQVADQVAGRWGDNLPSEQSCTAPTPNLDTLSFDGGVQPFLSCWLRDRCPLQAIDVVSISPSSSTDVLVKITPDPTYTRGYGLSVVKREYRPPSMSSDSA